MNSFRFNLSRWALAAVMMAGVFSATGADLKWVDFPDARWELHGLAWFKDNQPDLWRLPKRAQGKVPKAVWNRAIAPDGGRIRFSSDTTRLALRVQMPHGETKRCFFDVWVGTNYTGSASVAGTQQGDLVLFDKREHTLAEMSIYFPHKEEVRVLAVGVDENAKVTAASPFALSRPMVCYGSSVMQGSGATHPSRTYPAGVARRLNVDFVNLGFGGAGKAEPEVVGLVNELDASCFVFDLGKSYGLQPGTAYEQMLDAVRAAHPKVPIFCITPIYSTKEVNEPAYRKRSEDLRVMMRAAGEARKKAGDDLMFVIDGLELFGEKDKALFHDPAHPNDEGNERMAERLAPLVEKVLFKR